MMKSNQLLVITLIALALISGAMAKDKKNDDKKLIHKTKDKDMMRKSIVFDKKTPDVFYCPSSKPSGFDKLIVRSRPLWRLCEFEGKPLPPDYKSDCYQDIDESDYACKEKYRIMMRLYPPGSPVAYNGTRLKRFLNLDEHLKPELTKD